MSAQPELITFVIMGQEFRLRATPEEEKRMLRVAQAMDQRIRDHREQGAISELRAVLMAVFETGYELDEVTERATKSDRAEKTLAWTERSIESLLRRLGTAFEE